MRIKSLRLKLIKHIVAATVFLGVCSMVIQISVFFADIPIEALGLQSYRQIKHLDWFAAIRTLMALTLGFYLSRKSSGVFDRFLNKRRFKSSNQQRLN